ncbi:TM2 domain-containing protein [Bifidobacterium pseudocatenulatum]|uniref:TM2 domain-containing protein n=1 Tax=Bifidobacterium pseudocatenulatum TaxID=28026 RepID=UPI001D0E7DE9|nr:TM2 domain-containing protein [Bifidobacterium pseudocatenulatum]MCC2158744.1 TM2 domain-containing protein [Bifidobacterium pseudocatenulatum]
MSDNNADYNGSGQDEYFATNDSTQADYRQSQDGYNQPASQPHNPNPYASQQPVQGYAPGTQGNNIPGGTYGNGQPYGQSAAYGSSVPAYGSAAPAYGQPTQPQYTQSAYNQPPTYAQQTYYQATQQQPGYGYAQKSKIVAGLLGLFLGTLGVHNFYLGYTGKAVAQLLLTLIGWIILIGPIISGIWALIEAVLILCSSYGSNWHRDGHGQELQD